MSFWMRTIRKLILIAHGTYNARKFWTHRTSGSVRCRTITWKYAYKNLTLHSGSLTCLVVMHFRSSTRNRSLCIDYWTLNSHNIYSMFAVYARFMLSRSHISSLWNNYNYETEMLWYPDQSISTPWHYVLGYLLVDPFFLGWWCGRFLGWGSLGY